MYRERLPGVTVLCSESQNNNKKTHFNDVHVDCDIPTAVDE